MNVVHTDGLTSLPTNDENTQHASEPVRDSNVENVSVASYIEISDCANAHPPAPHQLREKSLRLIVSLSVCSSIPYRVRIDRFGRDQVPG